MTLSNHGNAVGTPNTVTEKPISPEEVEEFMMFLFHSDKLKCEAKHEITRKGHSTRPSGPCIQQAEYRGKNPDHSDPAWHAGKNVCSEFVFQVTAPAQWTFILI